MEKETPAEATARRAQVRDDAAWLRRLAEEGEAKLSATAQRPAELVVRPSGSERDVQRAQARADAAWLRALAERAKAQLERHIAPGEIA